MDTAPKLPNPTGPFLDGILRARHRPGGMHVYRHSLSHSGGIGELVRVETITAIVQERKSQQSIPALAVGFTVGTFWDNLFAFAS